MRLQCCRWSDRRRTSDSNAAVPPLTVCCAPAPNRPRTRTGPRPGLGTSAVGDRLVLSSSAELVGIHFSRLRKLTLTCVQSQDPSINHPPPEPVQGLDCVTRHLRVDCGAQHVCGKAPDARRTPWCYCPPPSSRARGLLAASRARDPAGADSLPLYGRCLIPRNTGTRVPEEPQPHSN